MDILKFTLTGKTAFFKKPEVNSYYYFTYGSIHKVALLGLFGAVLGLNGYGQREEKSKEYAEFYEKLHHMKVSIAPNAKDGYIPKKMQIFNNTVGYASKEQGGTLNIKQQWLENPSWDICFVIEDPITRQLANKLLNRQTTYIPYLGSNDHLADITNVQEFNQIDPLSKCLRIHSLYEKEKVQYMEYDEYEDNMKERIFLYEEELPVALDAILHLYQLKEFAASNIPIKQYKDEVFLIGGKNVVFF
ncbi:MAG: type I-B CRISPR-associated protein Cas5b [bacterium]|nr:type I-B CRISPR-associated protein Cas5b [bacterium]